MFYTKSTIIEKQTQYICIHSFNVHQLNLDFVAMFYDKTLTKMNLGKKRVNMSYTSIHEEPGQELNTGVWTQELKQNPQRKTAYGLAQLFFCVPQVHLLRDGTNHHEMGHPATISS